MFSWQRRGVECGDPAVPPRRLAYIVSLNRRTEAPPKVLRRYTSSAAIAGQPWRNTTSQSSPWLPMTWSATPDDESGPENPDPESFAGDDAGADDTEEEEPQIDALAVAAVAVTGGSVAAMPALPTAAAGAAAPGVPRPPGLHALTEADASKLKVPELARLVGCRAQARATRAVVRRAPARGAASRRAGRRAIAAAGTRAAWMGLDETAAIPRPQFAGDEDWKPSASVGLGVNDHPFMWFNKYMTTAMREGHLMQVV
eukprot:scaffold5178_cov107-Isochrysis_galbana.AAC.1